MAKNKKPLAGIGVVVGAVLVASMLHAAGFLDAMNKKLSNGLYDGREISDEIVIVAIDDASLAAPDEGGLGSTNWSREYYADAINNIRADGANSIFVDILFQNETKFLTHLEIANILLNSTNFSNFGEAVAGYLDGVNPQDQAMTDAMGNDVFMFKYPSNDPVLENGILSINGEVGSLDAFTENANSGFADTGGKDDTESIYTLPVGYVVNGIFEESLSVKMARDYLNVSGGEFAGGGFVDGNSVYEFDKNRQIPVEGGEFLVNYAGEAYSFPSISFVDVYNDRAAKDTFKNKIVLIGATATIIQDRHLTPIDESTPMPGVEIQANAIQTILDGAFLRHQGAAGFVVLVTVLVALTVGAALFAPVLAGAGVLVAEIVAFPFYAKWSFGRGVIPDLIWPMFAVVVAYLAVLAYRNFTEFREKRQIKQAFGHYVSADLVEQISENPDMLQLGGERRNITVLFLDIENFTSLSEKLEPTQVVQIINTYFDSLARVIMSNGGTVDKFEGDAIMALFGAPVPSSDHGLKACMTALAIREKMAELNKTSGQNLNIRIGIATGDAIVGNMGSKERFDYTAMGDTVNTASRLEGGNKFYGTRILVNSKTVDSAQSALVFRRVDRVRLKGKSEALDIFEVMGTVGGLSEDGKAVLEMWHQALEYYRNRNWAEAEEAVRKVLHAMPEDGPALTFLKRIDALKKNPPAGWDGTWGFSEK